MAAPAIPANFYVDTADAKVYLAWSLVGAATSYQVQRSSDGVTYTNLTAPTDNFYEDTDVTVAQRYYYQVASIGTGGTSSYTSPIMVIPCPPGEYSLYQIRTLSKMKADRVNGDFVTTTEWNEFIRLASYELYDLLIGSDEDMYMAPALNITLVGNQNLYPLPDGTNNGGAQAMYKLKGVDLATGAGDNNIGWVTLKKFNFIDRNKYFFPNTAGTIYGVYNMSYRMIGNNLDIIPNPSGGQIMRMWYIPRLPQLLKDNDTTTISISGWIQYVIVRAAKYALDKEESDTSKLDSELLFLKQRIEAMAQNRDMGQPDTISDTRSQSYASGWGGPGNGFQGGW